MNQTAAALATDARTEIVDALNQSVAETAVTTMLAQNFHWNVTGMAFAPLHALFQDIYEDHFIGQDDLAERIKALNAHADGTLAGMLKRSKVDEHSGHASDKEMIKTFNCGVGFCLIVNSKNLKKINKYFSKDFKPYEIGKIINGKKNVKLNGQINWKK